MKLKHRPLAAAALAVGVTANLSWLSPPHVRPLFLSGTPAPAGLKFASLGRAATNSRGSICVLAGWDGAQRRREGLYLRRGGEVVPVVRAGDLIPGSPGARFSFPPEFADEFSSFSLNDHDEVAFIVRQGLFVYSGGQIRAVARVDEALPGTLDERWAEILAVSLNDAGAVAFIASTRSVADGERHEGLFLAASEEPKIVQFVGDEVPGLDGELTGIADVALNNAGQIASLVRVGEDGLAALLLTGEAGTQVIAAQGQSAPGGSWADLGSVALNVRGDIAFQGWVETPDEVHIGVYRSERGAIQPLAEQGQSLDDEQEETLGGFLSRPVMDDDGNVAFVAELAGEGHPQALVQVDGGHRVGLAVTGLPRLTPDLGPVERFIGLNRGGLHGGRLVCAVTMTGDGIGDAVLEFLAGQAPRMPLSSADSLPPGSALVTVDDQTAPRESQARINRRGELLFCADVGGYGRTLFRQRAPQPELLVPLGSVTGLHKTMRSVLSFGLNDAGEVAFLALHDEEGRDAAIYTTTVDGGAAPRLVATTGQAVPGVSRRTITRLGPPQIDGAGRVLFAALGAGVDERSGAVTSASYLLAAEDGRLALLAAEGEHVSGVGTLLTANASGDEAVSPASFFDLQVNERGDALFVSTYLDAATGIFIPAGLFLLSDGSLRLAAAIGQRTPLPMTSTYSSLSAPRLSDGGAITFLAGAVGAGRKPRFGLFRIHGGETVPLAMLGDAAPAVDGGLYRALQAPAINAVGDTAFLALLEGAPEVRRSGALYISNGTESKLVVAPAQDGSLTDGATMRMDDLSPAAPLAFMDNGSLLVAAREAEVAARAGLYLIEPDRAPG